MAELQARMSQAEYIDWMAYYRIVPPAGVREDQRAARLMSLIANVNRDEKRTPKAYQPDDFMPDFWGKPGDRKPGTPSQNLLAKFRALTEDLPHGR